MNYLKTPGARSTEFAVTILNIIVQVVLAWTDTVSSGNATKYGLAGTVAYIISRGLAKYEGRPAVPPAAPPAA